MKPRVVTILSTNYAGSHFLSLMLGSHPNTAHIGEAHRLAQTKEKESIRSAKTCFLCGGRDECQLFSDITPDNISDTYPLIFNRLHKNQPEVNTLIDTSKRIDWAQRFLDDDRIEKKFIHLIRDPRALARRWMLKYPKPRNTSSQRYKFIKGNPRYWAQGIVASKPLLYSYKWLIQNQRITRFLKQNDLDYQVVSYEDLATETDRTLSQIMHWIGLDYQADQKAYWEHDHHGTQKHEYEWVKTQKKSFIDLRWQEFLPLTDQKSIASNKDFGRYLQALNLQMKSTGLSTAT